MSRIINMEGAGKERNYLTKAIIAAIRELAKQNEPGLEARDLVAFIIFSLETIQGSIEISVVAWEKRDYWVKADRFRMDWAWTGSVSKKMRLALQQDNWGILAGSFTEIAQKLGKIKVSDNHRLGTPWRGCWQDFKNNPVDY
jgi:hypothetical protein